VGMAAQPTWTEARQGMKSSRAHTLCTRHVLHSRWKGPVAGLNASQERDTVALGAVSNEARWKQAAGHVTTVLD
jgi:hypothetical protein